MATKVAINGFGRIGRQVFKAIRDRHPGKLEVVAVNDLVDAKTNAHLLKYDSNYGRFNGTVEAADGAIIVDGKPIKIFAERDPGAIPWASVGAEIVVESTGLFTDAEKARAHLGDTVRKVIISAPAKNEDKTIVLGVNDDGYDPKSHHVISNASCTTNGLAPVVKVLLDNFGILKGQMTTVHAYTNSQRVLDVAHSDLREARAAALNIVPFTTGAAKALKLVIPEIEGKLDGLAYRVPTPTVSIVEVVCLTEKDTTPDEVNDAMRDAASERMKGILDVVEEHVVSMDMKGDEHSSIVHAPVTNVVAGNLVKVAAWYDNEWGYACRTADLCAMLAQRGW
jgi:glyceraldehyde 3-phosphate dehydrogenase